MHRTRRHNENTAEPGAPLPRQRGIVDLSGIQVVVDPSQQVDLEQVAALEPDLILATNLSSIEDVYPRLTGIAPTVAYTAGWNADSWQDTATTIGRSVGRADDVAAVITGLQDRINELAAPTP